MNEILRVEDVHRGYGTQEVLKGVSISITAGEFVGIMGPSGSGKTTLLHIMGGILSPDSGTVNYNGKQVNPAPLNLRAAYRREVGFVFQNFNILNELTVLENLLLSMMVARLPCDREEAMKQLRYVGMEHKADAYPDELSMGELQRVAIARCMVRNPSIVFADEPTGSLDTANKELVMEIFRDIHKRGKTLVVVSHDSNTLKGATRIIELVDGRIFNGEPLR